MIRSFGLAVLIALCMTAGAYSASLPQPPHTLLTQQGGYGDTDTLSFAMWSLDSVDDGVADVYVAVRSRSDMPVPNVSVYLTTCTDEGQQTPLLLAHAIRHMDGQHETLHAFNGGKSWEWQPFSAPANTDQWLVLKLSLKASALGPIFCVQGTAWTSYDHGTNPVIERKWNMK